MPYTGHNVEIPCGQGGLSSDRNVARIPPSALILAEGIIVVDGAWRKEPGAALYGSAISGTPKILALHDWWPNNATQRLVCAASDGKLYKSDGAGDLDATTLTTGLSTTVRGRFVEGGKEAAAQDQKLFYFTGTNPVQVVSGTGDTAAALSDPPADWASGNQPISGVLHRGALWAFGNWNDPHRVYKSLTSDHEDFTSTPYTQSVFSGIGQRLVAGCVFQGVFFLWKYPRGIFWFADEWTDSTYWHWKQKSEALGAAASPHAVLPLDDDVLFLTHDGRFHLLSAIPADNLSNTVASDLSAALRIDGWIRDNVNLSRIDQVVSCWNGAKKQATFGLPRAGSTENDLRIVFDFEDYSMSRTVRVFYSYRDKPVSLAVRRHTDNIDRPILGTDAGTVYLLDQDNRSKDGAGYPAVYQTPPDDFGRVDQGLATQRKVYDALELTVNPLGNWNVLYDVFIDDKYSQSLSFDMGEQGAALGSFVLGTHALGGGAVLRQRKRLIGSGYRISLYGSNSEADQDFSIIRQVVACRVGGEER